MSQFSGGSLTSAAAYLHQQYPIFSPQSHLQRPANLQMGKKSHLPVACHAVDPTANIRRESFRAK
jgi:hypothetical protein